MKNKSNFFLFFFLFSFTAAIAQQDSLKVTSNPDPVLEEKNQEKEYEPYNALAPSKAAFFSAIVPGLGQAYNGSYWKIPIAYAGLGTGIYFYLDNDKKYNRFRDAYKNRLAGRPDEFNGNGEQPFVATASLIRAQEQLQKNKEISILVTVGIYILNIIDANVEAHLRQFNVDEDLSVKPDLDYDTFSGKTNYGLTLNYRF